MKRQRLLVQLTAMMFSLMLISSCRNTSSDQKVSEEAVEEVSTSGPEYTSAYICPMHCAGSGSDQPGNCPKCKMEYVANENFKADAKAGSEYSCPMHPDVKGGEGDSCSTCGMALKISESPVE